jgi:hypothetical protein
MRFQFVSDVDCESVLNRALAVGPSALITSALPDRVPEFVAIQECIDGEAAVALPFREIVDNLIDYFGSLRLDSRWNPVADWRDIELEEGPGNVREDCVGDSNKIAGFIIRYCTEMLAAAGISESLQRACIASRRVIETSLGHGDLSSVTDAARELHSAIPPIPAHDPASCHSSVYVQEETRLSQNSGVCHQREDQANPRGISEWIRSDEIISEILPDPSTVGNSSHSGETLDVTENAEPKDQLQCQSPVPLQDNDSTVSEGKYNPSLREPETAGIEQSDLSNLVALNTEGMQECDFAVTAVIERELGAVRFGSLNLIRMAIGGRWRFFAAKYYEYEDGCEELGDSFVDALNAFRLADHPCLAHILYYQKPGLARGPIIATEYFATGSLNLLLKDVRGGKRTELWTPSIRVIIICGIVRGLMALHSRHLFHGYLKPTDILLDSQQNVHLADCLSFSLERLGLAFSSMVGSPIYAAPELYTLEDEPLIVGDPIDSLRFKPIDVYCVGLICYEILSGNKVFSPTLSAAELRRKTMNSQERPPIPSSIKGDFGKVIERSWNPDQSKRPTIDEIWDVLDGMNFQIIDGVDSDLVKQRIATWSQSP